MGKLTPYSTAWRTCVLKYAPASELPTGMCFCKFIDLSVVTISWIFEINIWAPFVPTAPFGSVAPFAFR